LQYADSREAYKVFSIAPTIARRVSVKRLFIVLLLLLLPALASAQSPNLGGTLLPSVATSGAQVNSPVITNPNYKGVHVIINVSSYTSGTYTPHIQAQDPASLNWYDLLVGAGISGTGLTVLKLYPAAATTPNGAAADMLPKTWRVILVGTSTPSMTVSIGFFADL
jgi:hypothetical protein